MIRREFIAVTAATLASGGPDYLSRVFGKSRGVRRLEGRKLFFPEELPDTIADEARRLWAGR
jgi:haloalkane dehalogenase